jgi:hypothetical protein
MNLDHRQQKQKLKILNENGKPLKKQELEISQMSINFFLAVMVSNLYPMQMISLMLKQQWKLKST